MLPLTLLQFSSDLRLAIQIGQSIAREHQNGVYTPAHLLRGILHDDVGLSSVLLAWGKDVPYLREWAEVRIRRCPKAIKVAEAPPGDEQISKLFEIADIVRLKLSQEMVTPLAVLAAMCKPNVAFTPDQLKTFPLTEHELLEAGLSDVDSVSAVNPVRMGKIQDSAKSEKNSGTLERFCLNKNEQAKAGKLDPVIGRDREIQEMAKILGRRSKPNVILIGEPGVGKSALVEGFVQRVVDGRAPSFLENAQILELDMGALIAGASYKGEIEDRLKSIIKEIKASDEKSILFIDEIHVLLDPKAGTGGVANLLKPELARGDITVIGATTYEEYRKFIEKDDAFKRRFDSLEIKEPDREKTLRMLKALLPRYEIHHSMSASETALDNAVWFAMRYLKERCLPDSAIDLIDRTMAAVKVMKDTSAKELADLKAELELLKTQFSGEEEEKKRKEFIWFDIQIRDRISPILIGKLKAPQDPSKIDSTEQLGQYLHELLEELSTYLDEEKKDITPEDIAAIVAYATGIPVGKIQADERDKLQHMTDSLKGRIIGQDHALETIASAIGISRAGLADSKRPIGSFFFLGPTGTGKTELAKSIADYLFNDERALIRFDMSEFTEKHTAQFLIGAPPGYVGYEEGGALVNAIRQQPYAIVLFDEIEKAHPEVFKTFLQILDDGRLSDKLGKEGDFSNAIILFTSNIGSEYIVEKFSVGHIPEQQELIATMSQYFKDEFLGRLTEIIPFAPISEAHVVKIFNIQLRPLKKSLESKGMSLVLTEKAENHLAMKGFSPRFGARPLRRVIANDLQKPLSKMIIEGKIHTGQQIFCDYINEALSFNAS